VLQLLGWVPEDSSGSTGLAVNEDECRTLDAVVPLPIDGEVGVGFFDVDGLGLPIPRQLSGELILCIQEPSIAGLRREEDKLPDRDDSSVVSGCAPLNLETAVVRKRDD